MKYLWGFLIVLITLINLCKSQKLFVDPNAKHPDYPDKCYYKLTGHIFGVGQFHRPNGKEGGCFAYECTGPSTIAAHGCEAHDLPGCKRLRKDSQTPHPHCCERYLCLNRKGEYIVVNPSIRADLEKLKD